MGYSLNNELRYPVCFYTCEQIDVVIEYQNGFDNLYYVGCDGQDCYNNMDHAIIKGFKTVKDLLEKIADHINVWNVDTEKEHHEEEPR